MSYSPSTLSHESPFAAHFANNQTFRVDNKIVNRRAFADQIMHICFHRYWIRQYFLLSVMKAQKEAWKLNGTLAQSSPGSVIQWAYIYWYDMTSSAHPNHDFPFLSLHYLILLDSLVGISYPLLLYLICIHGWCTMPCFGSYRVSDCSVMVARKENACNIWI